MNRTIEYLITEKEDGLRIEQFLRRKGYSGQNLAEIKRMPKSILVNGVHYYMRQTLTAGDILKVIICETKCSEKIPPVEIPLDIIPCQCTCMVLPEAGQTFYLSLLQPS